MPGVSLQLLRELVTPATARRAAGGADQALPLASPLAPLMP